MLCNLWTSLGPWCFESTVLGPFCSDVGVSIFNKERFEILTYVLTLSHCWFRFSAWSFAILYMLTSRRILQRLLLQRLARRFILLIGLHAKPWQAYAGWNNKIKRLAPVELLIKNLIDIKNSTSFLVHQFVLLTTRQSILGAKIVLIITLNQSILILQVSGSIKSFIIYHLRIIFDKTGGWVNALVLWCRCSLLFLRLRNAVEAREDAARLDFSETKLICSHRLIAELMRLRLSTKA